MIEAKEAKPENTANETAPKPSVPKAQKTVYPDEVAKSVIRDIELLKKSGFGFEAKIPLLDIQIPDDPVVSLAQVTSDSPSVSVKSDQDNVFLKREIKCRNIRKTVPFRPRSVSPQMSHETADSASIKYPKNWTEYKEMNLNVEKDSALKLKLFKKSKDMKFNFKSYLNFETPSVPIENFTVKFKSGFTRTVPFSHLRCTATKPQILYSTNHKSQPGYLTRQQLFAQISKEKMLIIEKLGEFSRCQPFENALTSRKWYPKTWKKVDWSEVKLVENSVGLSFLQNYSDDEENVLVEDEPLNVEQNNSKSPSIERTSQISAKPPVVSKDSESLIENQKPLPTNVVVKKSKWDDIETVIVNASSNDRTPPIEDQEEGEVISDEDEKCDIAREYEKTKEELEKLEATLKTSTLSLDNSTVKKPSQTSSDKKRKKKKHKKDHRIEASKSKLAKKKSTRKSESGSYLNSSSESMDSEDETNKRKNKKKKSSKRKHQKSKSRRVKKKRLKKKANRDRSQSEDFDVESDLEDSKLKSKNKLKDNLKMRLEPSCETGVKDSDDSNQENYDDDIKFFAARFDAETKLKGKSKNKTAPIIALEDLSVPHSKLDERVSKRKSIESDSVVSPDANLKKNEENDKEDAVAVKVDLLKMNEDYLREQKKKEEEKICIPSAESAIDSEGKMLLNADSSVTEEVHIDKEQTEKPFKECTEIENNFDRLCRAEEFVSGCVQQASGADEQASGDDQQARGEDYQANGGYQQASAGEQAVDVPNAKLQNTPTKPKIVEPDWNVLKNKRKLLKSDAGGNLNEKPLNDSFESSIELHAPAVRYPLLDIVKKEAEENELCDRKSNSWQTIIDFQSTKSRSLNLEMPLNIKPFLRRDMKIEKDSWDIEEAPTRRSYENSKKTHKNRESEQLGSTDKSAVPTTKKRSDNTIPDPILIKLEKSDEVIDAEFNNSNNCITLENEYEEFLKAVSSTKKLPSETFMSDCCPTKCVKPRIPIDADNFCIEEYPVQTSVKAVANLEDLLFTPVSDDASVQIPLPQIQPIPGPSPNIETVIDINKSLINLSVPVSVTQNSSLSLATSAPSISAPTASIIDTSKTDFQIPNPLNIHSLPLFLNTTASSSSIDAVSVTTPEMMDFENNENRCNGGEEKSEKLTFTALTLPSKKLLIGKSKLNLDDSDSEDLNMVEAIKRKKLESLIENNKKEIASQPSGKSPEQSAEADVSKDDRYERDKQRRDSREKISPNRHRRDSSPSIHRNRSSSVRRRDFSPRRRPFSPRRKSPKRRSPTLKRKLSSRRSMSPKRRRRTPSPRRRRSPLLKGRSSPRRHRSTTPKNRRGSISKENRPVKRPKSPLSYREMSPPKRSVADSTISDEQLQQDNDYCPSGKGGKTDSYSPRQRSLDDRINEVLGMPPAERGAHPDLSDAPYYNKSTDQYQFDGQNRQFDQQYSNIQSQVSAVNRRSGHTAGRMLQSTYKQVGNMLQIVPTENLINIPVPYNMDSHPSSAMADYPTCSKRVQPNVQATPYAIKSKYLQVGNMLQIVPTEMVSCHPVEESADEKEIKPDVTIENGCFEKIESEKSSAESSMMQKVAERRAEKENRRQERERRRKEKERRKKAKEKVRQARLKVKTENMIRRALELEGQDEDNMEFELASKLVQWPPIPNVAAYCLSKEAGKSILMNNKTRHLKEKKVKLVQFADGIRPGEGTSPSGGEELSSPPPPDKQLPKEKRFRKLKFGKTSAKKKVKVKIIRKLPSPLDESESDDNLPPPSPPPGSPPPHIFPPRIKTSTVNNVPPPFLASIMHTAQHQQQQQPQQQAQFQSNMYRPPLNMLLTHPPNLQGHLPTHGAVVSAGLSPQGHYHPGMGGPPPPPPQSHSSGHNRHY